MELGRARLGTGLVFFICGIGHGTWAPRLADIKAKIGASDGELGLSLLLLGVGALIGMPVAGGLVGRFGSRAVSLAAALAHGLVFPLMAFAWSWVMLGIAMLLYGLAVGSLDVAMNVQATEIERERKTPIMSSFHGVYSVGDMSGALATGLLASLAFGLTSHFLLAAAVLLLMGAGGCWMMIPDRRAEPTTGGPAFVRPSGILVLIGLIAFVALVAEGSVGDWSASICTNTRAPTPRPPRSRLPSSLWPWRSCALPVTVWSPALAPSPSLQASASLAAAGLAIALSTGTPAFAILGYGIAGLGVAVLFPVALSIAPRLSGFGPSSSVAVVATLGYGGFLIGPPVIGLLADQVGLPLALGLVVALLVATLPLMWLAGQRLARDGGLAVKAP